MTTGLPILEDIFVPGAGVRLHARAAGPQGQPLILLLHGFPEFWYGWRQQIGPLSDAGYRVLALDQRGYNLSDKPRRVGDYAIDQLGNDVIAVLDALQVTQAVIVGHDWGGAVGWWLGIHHPERVSRLVVLNCPHPVVMQDALTGNIAQLIRSWYIFAVQMPILPEWLLQVTRFRLFERTLRQTARRCSVTTQELGEYRKAWSEPGALTGMLNWYRAAPRFPDASRGRRVLVPTLLLWGERDAYLRSELARTSAALCDNIQFIQFPEATHWIQHDAPDRVNALILDFIRGLQHDMTQIDPNIRQR